MRGKLPRRAGFRRIAAQRQRLAQYLFQRLNWHPAGAQQHRIPRKAKDGRFNPDRAGATVDHRRNPT